MFIATHGIYRYLNWVAFFFISFCSLVAPYNNAYWRMFLLLFVPIQRIFLLGVTLFELYDKIFYSFKQIFFVGVFNTIENKMQHVKNFGQNECGKFAQKQLLC